MRNRQHAIGWSWALAAALALHAAALVLLQARRHPVTEAPGAPAVWHVSLRAAPQAAAVPRPSPPAIVSAAPAPAVAPRSDRQRPSAAPSPVRREPPAPRPEVAPPPPVQPLPTVAEAPAPDPQTVWLDASKVDSAPTPNDNLWLLAEQPWPAGFPIVRLRVWLSAQGRIERFELEGPAADDPAMRDLFAPIVDTPMRPAMLGGAPVASVMRIEMWPGEGPAPDFLAPMAPASAPR